MLSPDCVRERFERRARARSGPAVTVVAATKYVAARRHGACSLEAGHRGGRREPRAGSRGEARRVRRRVPLALHRAPAVEQGEGREPASASSCHSLDSRVGGAPARDARARAGEPRRRGVEVGRRARRVARVSRATTCVGLSTMPPAAATPRIRGRGSAAARARRASTASRSSRWGRPRTTRSRPRRARPTSGSDRSSFEDVESRRWRSATSGTVRSSTSASPRRTTTGTTRTATPPRRASSRATASGRTSAG